MTGLEFFERLLAALKRHDNAARWESNGELVDAEFIVPEHTEEEVAAGRFHLDIRFRNVPKDS